MDACQTPAVGINLRQTAQSNVPPAVRKNLDVPRVPARVLRISPSFLLENFFNLGQQMDPLPSLLAPERKQSRTEKRQGGACIFFRCLHHRIGSPFPLQPGKVTCPVTYQGLGQREIEDGKPSQHRVVLGLDPRQHHERDRRQKGGGQHQERDNPDRLYLNRDEEDKKCQGIPLQATDQLGPGGRRLRIETLKKSGSENPVINDRSMKNALEAG